MSQIFHEILFRPLFNSLIFLYNTVAFGDLGVAIIVLTIIIRLILYPLFWKSYKNQELMRRIQPAIKKIQHDHKGNRERQAQALLELYKQHKVNPFSGFFLILIQLPVLIALYRVFLSDFSQALTANLYGFIPPPAALSNVFLGLINLAEPNIIIVGLAAAAQYFQGKLTLPKTPSQGDVSPAEKISKQMVFIGPLLTLIFLYTLPAAIGLYWLTTAIFSVIQQLLIIRSLKGNGAVTEPSQKNA